MSHLEQEFADLWNANHSEIDLWMQHKFDEKRKFLIDFASPPTKTGVEIQGGIFMRYGAHNTGKAIQRDCEKQFLALSQGWVIFYLTEDMIDDDHLAVIAKTIIERKANAILLETPGWV